MKGNNNRQHCRSRSRSRKRDRRIQSAAAAGLVVVAVLGGLGFTEIGNLKESGRVYAASDETEILPTGIADVLSDLTGEEAEDDPVFRVGSSCENVLVGQRVSAPRKEEHVPVTLNISSQMESAINSYASRMQTLAASPRIMSDKDYDSLLRIVEAEAGIEDTQGKVLVANVLMNRVADSAFPDTVYDVVWQNTGGVPQFSPTYDGRIYRVKVSDDTREAVRQAMSGVDYSQGALYFMAKSAAEEHNVDWFESDLKYLFKYGYHEFYTVPDYVDMVKADVETASEEPLA